MLKKILLIVLPTLLLSGCSFLQVADSKSFRGQKLIPESEGEAIALVTGYVSGFYLFQLPLFAGDPEEPGSISWFTNTVKPELVTRMVAQKCKSLGADRLAEMQIFYTSDTNIIWIIPYVFYTKTASVSAVATISPRTAPLINARKKLTQFPALKTQNHSIKVAK